ncbi:MAG: phosphotransferase [Spongiibacteraceae bacterium]
MSLENLTDRGTICSKVIPALSVERLANLLTTLAQLHAPYWESSRLQEILNDGPQTFLYDAHPGNIYFLPDGTVGLFDWQLARRGPWTHDVSYAIISALDTDDRRSNERDLFRGYRE